MRLTPLEGKEEDYFTDEVIEEKGRVIVAALTRLIWKMLLKNKIEISYCTR